jgi:hypothetical protein
VFYERDIFLKVLKIKSVLSVSALTVFTIFGFLFEEKIKKRKVLLASMKKLTNLNILSETLIKKLVLGFRYPP